MEAPDWDSCRLAWWCASLNSAVVGFRFWFMDASSSCWWRLSLGAAAGASHGGVYPRLSGGYGEFGSGWNDWGKPGMGLGDERRAGRLGGNPLSSADSLRSSPK